MKPSSLRDALRIAGAAPPVQATAPAARSRAISPAE
jgi:hypothetical protein